MTNHSKTLKLVEEAFEACKNLSRDSDWYDTFERRERYNIAKQKVEKLNQHLLEQGTSELKNLDFDNPFDSAEKFFRNEGWTIEEFEDIDGMDIIHRYGEARYGSAVALSELNHVESEPITDSRPYGIAAECAKDALEGSLKHIESIN